MSVLKTQRIFDTVNLKQLEIWLLISRHHVVQVFDRGHDASSNS